MLGASLCFPQATCALYSHVLSGEVNMETLISRSFPFLTNACGMCLHRASSPGRMASSLATELGVLVASTEGLSLCHCVAQETSCCLLVFVQ